MTDTPVWIMGNGQALRRIIQNIVKNGLDHGNKELKIQLKKKENRAKLVFKNRVDIRIGSIFKESLNVSIKQMKQEAKIRQDSAFLLQKGLY